MYERREIGTDPHGTTWSIKRRPYESRHDFGRREDRVREHLDRVCVEAEEAAERERVNAERDDVREALMRVIEAGGNDAAKDVLGRVGVSRVSELHPAAFDTVIELCEDWLKGQPVEVTLTLDERAILSAATSTALVLMPVDDPYREAAMTAIEKITAGRG